MTDDEFAAGVDAIISTGIRGHASHRALDLWWSRYAIEQGGALETATRKWMAHIEGDHDAGKPYPVGRRSFWRGFLCLIGRHEWEVDGDTGWITVWSAHCIHCDARKSSGNPCP